MRRRIVWMVVILLVVAGIGGFAYRRWWPGRTEKASAQPQTVAVQRGNLTVSVSATGGVASCQDVSLTFGTGGEVTQVLVKEGEQVKAGQVLAQLDTTSLEIALTKARLSLKSSEANLAKAKAGATEAELASAQANLASAQEKLAQVKAGPTKEAIAAAEATLKAAQENYQKLLAGPTSDDIFLAQTALEQAKLSLERSKNSLWSAQASRDATRARAGTPQYQIDQAEASVNQAELSLRGAEMDYEKAKITYATAIRGATAADLASALSQIEKAQDALNTLKSQPTAADLASAQAQVAQAESQLESLEAGPTDDEIASAEVQVEQAKLAVQEAQLSLDKAQLKASFGGTVTAIGVKVGQIVGTSAAVLRLVDLGCLRVDINMDEIDVSKVKVGQEVQVTLDAISGNIFGGKVSEVSVVGTTTQGVVNYPVKVLLEAAQVSAGSGTSTAGTTRTGGLASGAAPGAVKAGVTPSASSPGAAAATATVAAVNPLAAIKPGMTASARIIVDERQDVLLIPTRAVKTQSGRRYVEVQEGNATRQVEVKLGLSGDTMVEVADGLKEGDVVVIATTSAATPRVGTFGGLTGGGSGMIVR